MKRVLLLVCILTLCLGLCACSSENKVTHYKEGDVTLGQYKNLTYTPTQSSVSDDDFEDYVKYFCEQKAYLEDKGENATVETGDVVSLDFSGYKKGETEPFSGGTGSKEDLEIGSHAFMDGFEEALVGKTLGECEIECRFPENYGNAELKGVEAIFKCTIKSISRKVIPEFDDKFARENSEGECQTAAEFKEKLRKDVNDYQAEQAERNKLSVLEQMVVNNCTVNKDITEDVEASTKNLIDYYNSIYRDTYGCNASVYFRDYFGYTDDMFNEMIRGLAETQVKYALIRAAIADAENIEATDEEVAKFAEENAAAYGCESVDEFYDAITEDKGFSGQEFCREQIRLQKAENIIMDTAVAQEKETE